MGFKFQVIGYPIAHSLSPWIHGEFLKRADIQGTYTKREIAPHELTEQMKRLKEEEQIDGFNVTVPHKQSIIPLLDEVDDTAEKMGAVNTVVNQNGKWIGYNTDGIGYIRSLEKKFPSLFKGNNKRILILGAGGAARGIYYALNQTGFKQIDIANRTVQSARDIAELKSNGTSTNVLELHEAGQLSEEYDLIVQTTTVGMEPNMNEVIIPLNELKPSVIVSDIIYKPIKTRFLQQAMDTGAFIHFGHTMLIYQAQASFEIWTGKRIEIGDMDGQLQQILEGR